MIFLHSFIKQARELREMKQEVLLVLRVHSSSSCALHPGSRSSRAPLPVPFTATALAPAGARCSINK